MTVRRLAAAEIQPASFAFNRANTAAAKQWIKKYPKGRQQSAIIPLLMLAQEQEGWVTKAAIETVCDMLEMPYIRGLEVATFYTQYQLKPVGTRAHIQVCGTTPCMLRGSEDLMDVCRSKIHHDQFHTNDKGTLSWEEVECLGACVNAPMVMVFKDTYEDLTPERLAEIIDLYDSGKGASVPTGPQNGRFHSAPVTGFKALANEKAVLKSTRDREAKATKTSSAEAASKTAASPAASAPVKAATVAQTTPQSPAFSAKQANKAEPALGAPEGKQRKGPRLSKAAPEGAYQSPKILKGEPIGAEGKKASASAAPKNRKKPV